MNREELTVSRAHLEGLLADGYSWQSAAKELRISPGLAFLIRTGVPADGSGTPEISTPPLPGLSLSSPQELVNPRGQNPLRHEGAAAWVTRRAKRELTPHIGDGGGQRATAEGGR
jgi:hypothetical protein